MDDLFMNVINFLDARNQACARGIACSPVGREGCSQLETVRVLGSAERRLAAIPDSLREYYKLTNAIMRFWRKLQTPGRRIASSDRILVCRAFVPIGTQFPDQVQRAAHEHGVLRTC